MLNSLRIPTAISVELDTQDWQTCMCSLTVQVQMLQAFQRLPANFSPEQNVVVNCVWF